MRGWEARFDLKPDGVRAVYSVGFVGPAVMALEIPDLEPGKYRLAQGLAREGQGRFIAEFQVIE